MSHVTLYLPKNSKLHLTKGTKVRFGEDLASVQTVNGVVFNIADFLKIDKKDIPRVLRKKIGDRVTKHEILAEISTHMGFSKNQFKMPFTGVLQQVDLEKGLLTVYPELVSSSVSIKSPVEGVITDVTDENVTLEFDGTVHFGKQGIGGLGKGKLYVVSNENEEVSHTIITSDVAGAFLLGGYFPNQVLAKAASLGSIGILATKVDPSDFVFFDNNPLLRPILMEVSSVDYKALLPFHTKDIVVEGIHKRIYTI